MDRLLWTINTAKTTDSDKCSKTLAGAQFDGMWAGSSQYRPADHALMWPMWFGKLNPNGTPGDPHDVFHILDSQPADEIFITPAQAGRVCNLKYPA
jgi:hypothetical protein